MKTYFQNLGTVNKNTVIIETNTARLQLFFSYETVVAFRFNSQAGGHTGVVCRQNDWGRTTGKFLNEIQPDKKLRLESTEFEKQLVDAYSKL